VLPPLIGFWLIPERNIVSRANPQPDWEAYFRRVSPFAPSAIGRKISWASFVYASS